MGKNGYFLSLPKISIPPLSRVSQRWPLPQLVGHCSDKQRLPVVQFPVVAKVSHSGTWVLKA